MLELFRKLTRGLGRTFTGTAEINYQKGIWGIKEIFINMASFDTPLILLRYLLQYMYICNCRFRINKKNRFDSEPDLCSFLHDIDPWIGIWNTGKNSLCMHLGKTHIKKGCFSGQTTKGVGREWHGPLMERVAMTTKPLV